MIINRKSCQICWSRSPSWVLCWLGALLALSVTTKTSHAIVLTEDKGTCRILSFFPTVGAGSAAVVGGEEEDTGRSYERWSESELRRVSASNMATAYMAMTHFNERDASLVKEIANLSPECTVQLELDIITDHLDLISGGKIILEEGKELCAFLGTYDPDVARAMQPTSASLDLPQVIYYTLDQFLTSSKRPSAVGLPPTVLPHARALAEYLNTGQVEPPREYMAIVYEEAYTSSYMTACFQEDAADKYGLVTQKYQDDHRGVVPTITPEEKQREVLLTIRNSGVKTIFLNKIQSSSLALTAHILEEYGMLTDEFVYIFTPQAVPTDAVGNIFGPQAVDSALDRLLRGGAIFDHVDPFNIKPEGDSFLSHWKTQGSGTVQELKNSTPFPPLLGGDYFQTTHPADYSSYLYDSIIAVGMGACVATTQNKSNILPRTSFRSDIHTTNFTGASWPTEWGCYGSNRCNDPLRFGMFNIQAELTEDGKQHTYTTVATAAWDITSRWQKLAPFLYRDGTTKAPTLLREASETNYLSKGVLAFGIILYITAAFTALAGLIMVIWLRKDTVITRSQPFFLCLLCAGSLIMSTAILTLSFDEGWGISQRGLDAACMSSMWFFFVGHVLTFAALVAKMWRLDRVLKFRRLTITRKQASIPVLVLLAVTVLMLVIWTAVDPWTWERQWISLVPSETYGQCQSDHFWAFFGPLLAILVLAEGSVLVFAWKTKEVNEDLSDSQMSSLSISTQFQALIVGVPILAVLGKSSSNAAYLSRALLIWTLSISSVLLVIGRKVVVAIQMRHSPEQESSIFISGVRALPSQRAPSSKFMKDSFKYCSGSSSRAASCQFDDDDMKQDSTMRLSSSRAFSSQQDLGQKLPFADPVNSTEELVPESSQSLVANESSAVGESEML